MAYVRSRLDARSEDHTLPAAVGLLDRHDPINAPGYRGAGHDPGRLPCGELKPGRIPGGNVARHAPPLAVLHRAVQSVAVHGRDIVGRHVDSGVERFGEHSLEGCLAGHLLRGQRRQVRHEPLPGLFRFDQRTFAVHIGVFREQCILL